MLVWADQHAVDEKSESNAGRRELRKGDAELRGALDEYIENLRRTPTWSRLVVKYFGEMAPDVLKKARTESPSP